VALRMAAGMGLSAAGALQLCRGIKEHNVAVSHPTRTWIASLNRPVSSHSLAVFSMMGTTKLL
jgi:hypothetical protein